MQVFIKNKKVNLSPQKIIGKGGEAEIYSLNQKEVVKLFKNPSHIDFSQDLEAQKSAAERLQEHQQKLRQFPANLPANILSPTALVQDKSGKILGYTMPYLQGTNALYRYGDRRFREQHGISHQQVTKLFIQIHHTLQKLHQADIIVGDFNDLNILVEQNTPYFIDTDSWQFQSFLCQLFTARFVDPLLCDANLDYPQLSVIHNTDSDWYAFAVMLFRTLLYVEPYGGIYKNKQIPQAARPLHRITVFHADVKYPKPALPYKILNDDLLTYFQDCFKNDKRGRFPLQLLEDLHWKNCTSCGEIHSHNHCPYCHIQIAVTPLPTFANLQTIFATKGSILKIDIGDRHCHYLYWEAGAFTRENGQVIFKGDRSPFLNFWLNGDRTYVGQGQTILSFLNGELQPDETLQVETYREQPCFQCHQGKRYWISQGKLWRDGTFGRDFVGDVLPEQTQFWLGNDLGFGFYQAGNLLTGFIFSTHYHGLNDQVSLPKINGEILLVNCTIGRNIWLFFVVQYQGKIQHHVCVVDAQGERRSHDIFDSADFPNIEGHFATEDGLLVTTDQGLQLWSVQQSQLQTQPYPSELDSLMQTDQTITATSHSLYLSDTQHIYQLAKKRP